LLQPIIDWLFVFEPLDSGSFKPGWNSPTARPETNARFSHPALQASGTSQGTDGFDVFSRRELFSMFSRAAY
jgi:hypothetical protein